MDEIVDVVNGNDNIVGRKLKNECHKQRLYHRGAALFLFKDNSYINLLIQKRSKYKSSNAGKWNLISGHALAGEDYLQCIKRELKEEMFYKMDLPSLEFEEL